MPPGPFSRQANAARCRCLPQAAHSSYRSGGRHRLSRGKAEIVAIRISDAKVRESPWLLLELTVDRVSGSPNPVVLREDVIDLERDLAPQPPIRGEAPPRELPAHVWQLRDRAMPKVTCPRRLLAYPSSRLSNLNPRTSR